MCVILAACTNAIAQQSQITLTYDCFERESLTKYITENLGEFPVVLADNTKREYTFVTFVHPKTSEWSLIAYEKDRACVISTGNKIKFRNQLTVL